MSKTHLAQDEIRGLRRMTTEIEFAVMPDDVNFFDFKPDVAKVNELVFAAQGYLAALLKKVEGAAI